MPRANRNSVELAKWDAILEAEGMPAEPRGHSGMVSFDDTINPGELRDDLAFTANNQREYWSILGEVIANLGSGFGELDKQIFAEFAATGSLRASCRKVGVSHRRGRTAFQRLIRYLKNGTMPRKKEHGESRILHLQGCKQQIFGCRIVATG